MIDPRLRIYLRRVLQRHQRVQLGWRLAFSWMVMALVGLGFYAIAEQPKAWSGQPFLDWLDSAWLWAAALPGVASLIALAPNMQTKDTK